ncbi:hypothetical protein GTA09_08920 [Rhodococcus hoagii]|nr:hypothetical protein [Prescottella equi]
MKICGTHPDNPSPNRAQPSSVVGSHGDTTTVAIPAAAISVPYRTTATGPSAELTRSAVNRPTVIVSENAPNASAATDAGTSRCSLTCRVDQSLATPSASINANATAPSASTRGEYRPRRRCP